MLGFGVGCCRLGCGGGCGYGFDLGWCRVEMVVGIGWYGGVGSGWCGGCMGGFGGGGLGWWFGCCNCWVVV